MRHDDDDGGGVGGGVAVVVVYWLLVDATRGRVGPRVAPRQRRDACKGASRFRGQSERPGVASDRPSVATCSHAGLGAQCLAEHVTSARGWSAGT